MHVHRGDSSHFDACHFVQNPSSISVSGPQSEKQFSPGFTHFFQPLYVTLDN